MDCGKDLSIGKKGLIELFGTASKTVFSAKPAKGEILNENRMPCL